MLQPLRAHPFNNEIQLPVTPIFLQAAMNQQREAALRTQLKAAYNRLNDQIWNSDSDETKRDHFEQIALRHVYATTKIQSLPYQGDRFPGETANPTTWISILHHLVEPFWVKYQPVIWVRYTYDERIYKAALRDYFQILLQLPSEDTLIKLLIGQTSNTNPFE